MGKLQQIISSYYGYHDNNVLYNVENVRGNFSYDHNSLFTPFFEGCGSAFSDDGVYRTGYNMTYHYTFDFEEAFDSRYAIVKMRANFEYVCYIVMAYFVSIFGIQHYMKNKPKYELRKFLVVWNAFLALFSIAGALRTIPEAIFVTATYGMNYSVCLSGSSCFLDNRVGGFWNWMFTLSKVPELGDTIFIVLRKQPLIFLHWYHHVTVLLYSWYSYSDYIATARWFICMNYMVHSAMYTYYAFKALKFRVPRWISMAITTAQLLQMVMGTAVNIWAYQVKLAGNECHVSYENIKFSLLMYTSYFILFAHFFRMVYFAPKNHLKARAKKVSDVSYDYDKTKGDKLE